MQSMRLVRWSHQLSCSSSSSSMFLSAPPGPFPAAHNIFLARAGGTPNHQQAGSHLRPSLSRTLHREGTSLIPELAERFRRMIILAGRHRCASRIIGVSAWRENETGNAIRTRASQGRYFRLAALRSTSKVRSGNVSRKRGEVPSPKFHWGSQYTFRGWMGSTSPT